MSMAMGDIMQQVVDLRTTRKGGANRQAKFRRAINAALKHLAADVSHALLPSEAHVVVYPDVEGNDDAVGAVAAVVATDDLVLEFTVAGGAALSTASSGWTPNTDGTWDGIMHLEVKDPDGQWRRRKSLEWWSEYDDGTDTTRYYVTIDRPWRNATDTDMEFRIYQPHFWLRADVMRILDPIRLWDDSRNNIGALTPGDWDRGEYADFRGDAGAGPPCRYRRHVKFLYGQHDPNGNMLLVPSVAPSVSTTGTWTGPVQEGDFEFVQTFVWGRKDYEWSENPSGGVYEPQWESPPSPASASASSAGGIMQIQCLNPDAELGFNVTGSARETRSGYRVRIYVRRTSVNTGGLGSYNQADPDGVFYLLTEIDPANTVTGVDGQFEWDGAVIPDRRVRLWPASGYYGYQVWPRPDQRYELDIRCLRMPGELVHDRDVVPLQHDAFPCFIELVLYYVSLIDGGDRASAREHLELYRDLAGNIRQHYEQPAKAKSASAFGGIGGVRTIVPHFTG